MKKHINNRMHLFFLECILVIMIFASVSSILVGGVAKAIQLSKESKDKIYAMINISTIAEEIRSVPGVLEEHSEWYYDAAWQLIEEKAEAKFIIEGDKLEEVLDGGILESVNLVAKRMDEQIGQDIWQLELKHYKPNFHIGYEGGGYDEE